MPFHGRKLKVRMSFFNKIILALCATVALAGCQDGRVDVYIHEDTGCESDSDCDAAYDSDTFAWCDVEAGNGTCHYQTYVEQPSCYSDWDCDDGDPSSVDTCGTEGCTHVIRETVVVNDPAEANITATFTTVSRLTIANGTVWSHIGDLTISASDVLGRRQIFGIVFSSVNAGAWSGVALAQNGAIVNTVVPGPAPVGSYTSSIVFNFDDLTLTSGGSISYQVWGKVSESYFVSTTASDPTVSLALDGLRMNGIGEDVIVSSDSRIFYTYLRHSKPTVTRQALSTTTLTNSTQDLYKMQISADSNGSVEVDSLAFKIEGNSVNAWLLNFSVRVGSQTLPASDYTIRSEDGATDYKTGALSTGNGAVLIVHFTNPRIIVGSGIVVTLSATVAGTQSGDFITITPYNSSFEPITGYVDTAGRLVIPNFNTLTSSIVWRDGYHNFGNSYGDWAYGSYGISDLTQVQTLTR